MTTSSNIRPRIACTLAASILGTILTACGGGGGGVGPSNVPTAPTPPVVTGGTTTTPVFIASTIVTTAFAGSYAEAQDLAAFDLLNAQRSMCGFGTLSQNTALDTTARNHANWQLVNGYGGHYEEAINSTTHVATIGFTGVDPGDRAVTAGYAASTWQFSIADDFATLSGTTNKNYGGGIGAFQTRGLLSAPYHQRSLLDSFREVGISNRTSADVGVATYGARIITQMDLANYGTAGRQLPSTSDVLTYPCQGVTGTAWKMDNEEPAVIASRNYSLFPTGQPVVVKVRDGQVLTIATASITVTSTGAVVPLQPILTSANDAHNLVPINEAIIIPDVALVSNTSYTVAISGTNSGQAFIRNFTFSTGP